MEEMDFTRKFSLGDQRDLEIKAILASVYQALQEKGYNPINQIVGYILSEDPTYITNHNNARALIRKVDRDELLQTGQILSDTLMTAQRPADWWAAFLIEKEGA